MKRGPDRYEWNHAVALLVVLAMHGAVLYGLSSVRVIPPLSEAVPLFVTLITPSPAQPQPATAPPPAPMPKPIEPPRQPKPVKREAAHPVEAPHAHLAAVAPVVSPAERTEPLPSPGPVVASPESGAPGPRPSPPQAAGPMTLTSDLAVICPERKPPPYPPVSRRLGEAGKVVLRVELDATGRVNAARVITSSGYKRLDEAALTAVRTWRCQPAQHQGQAVRSVAVQPFDFTLEGQ
jgi:protein TonB